MNATRTPWFVSVLIAFGTFFAMFALSTLIDGSGWLRTQFFVLAICAGTAIGVRAVSRSRLLPTAAALVVAIIVAVPMFAENEEGKKHLLPTPGSLADLWRTLENGVEYAVGTPAPAEVTTALLALITAFAVGVFIVAEHLAASWRAVAVSGIVIMLPWTPAIFLQYRVPMWALFATAACWMLAMAAARSSMATHRTAPLPSAILATTAALVATLIVVPSALGGNGWGAIPRFNAPSALDASTRLNLALDLRNSLTVNSTNVVMTYVSTGRHPDTLRLYTYTDFDGSSWTRPKGDPPDSRAVGGDPLWPYQVEGWADADHVLLEFDVTGLSERNLPIPPVPRAVEVDGDWSYSRVRDEISTEGDGTRGMTYSVIADLEYFTKDSLTAAQSRIDRGEDAVGFEYTAVPASVDLARISSLAQEITADSTTRLEQAMAIQDYLRSSQNFTYDTAVSPQGSGDSVSQFLDDRRGYCVQFATTMVMLARSLDIPSRIAVGFLGGHLGDNGQWQVIGGDAHAWPELYFPGEGWVRFEPTPAVQTGNPPSYADVNAGQIPNPGNIPVPTTAPSTPAQPIDPDDPFDNPALTPEDEAGVPWWAIVVVVVLIAAAVAGTFVLRRRSAAKAAAHGPEAAWSALRERLPEDLRWSLTLTPHEAAQHVESWIEKSGGALTDEGAGALALLRDAVSDERYAPAGSDAEEERLRAAVEMVVKEADEAVNGKVTQKSP